MDDFLLFQVLKNGYELANDVSDFWFCEVASIFDDIVQGLLKVMGTPLLQSSIIMNTFFSS